MSMQLIALVPAAGRSARMGRPKLTLGLGRESVIQRVVRALEAGGASQVVVVAPPIQQPGAVVLANHARVEGAFVEHLPAETPDMRATIEFGLDAITAHGFAPDGLLMTPGDVPGLTPEVVAQVIRQFHLHPDRIIVPEHQGKRGHPLALSWEMALMIPALPPGVGVNALLEAHAGDVLTIAVENPGILRDLDTPEDYRRVLSQGS